MLGYIDFQRCILYKQWLSHYLYRSILAVWPTPDSQTLCHITFDLDTAILITCSNSINAHPVKSKLQSEGIECFLNNEHFTNLMPHYFGILGSGVQVVVNKEDLERARIAVSLNQDKITCPNCGSDSLSLFPVKSLYKAWMLILAFFAVVPIGNLLDQYRCKSCKTVFRL